MCVLLEVRVASSWLQAPRLLPEPFIHIDPQALWALLYLIGVVAFGCGLFVLYRNNRAAVGVPLYEMQTSDCERLDSGLQSVFDSVRFLTELTLSGGGDWHCFRASSSNAGGTVLAVR